ncbi:IS110 family transposase [Streptomyces sp. NA02950]|uniref:IS110 family transposase n=1 Tax=Streptomyces sp. NA02950 TaxID=2742137 RepID=UPI0015904721|nr:IS110 family transposase [Streptomyces sp. NA02950]QKV91697.1 IS110 family transposase [Streptomyces sp. NA02950]QKV93244.1 IS110 family transposase [Streptomyces sp. NA02950]QKV93815.1 IS110 family transposase [Streptomyces sp. NA02950]QKV93988.1 IS110 family transposase [Streptomyces sp. NA02950]QKV97034.1 IS110 family transposase [Streptomyces sp. NA02950]
MHPRVWAGIDAGKAHHHCVAIDSEGNKLLSRRVANDEPELLQLLADVLALGHEVVWAVDLADGGAALAITTLLAHDQQVLYISGRTVNRASEAYRGESKSDARDAAIIADQARMRRDLTPMRLPDSLSAELKLLTARRTDLVCDRTRTINRLRAQLNGIFPALERALDLSNAGPLILLTGYQTPASIRRLGRTRLEAWLRRRKVRSAGQVARTALEAAERQHTAVPGEDVAAELVHTLAQQLTALNEQIAAVDRRIAERFREHELAEVITSMPGIGPTLGAEFLAATNGDMELFGSPDRLAGFCGLAPASRDSGRISGNLRRPQRYHRGLQRVFYTSALISIQRHPESRAFYDRKRAEGKRHTQAVIALARRRVNVLWALLRDRRCYQAVPPVAMAA